MMSRSAGSLGDTPRRGRNRPDLRDRGMTLIELMVVVAIISILAGIAGVAYMRYLKQAKITQMKQYAMEIEQGEKEYNARNGYYLDIDQAYYTSDQTAREKWEDLLGFEHDKFESVELEAHVDAGGSGESCDICPKSLSPDTTGSWYAIEIVRDLDSGASKDTTVYLDNAREKTVLLHEGK